MKLAVAQMSPSQTGRWRQVAVSTPTLPVRLGCQNKPTSSVGSLRCFPGKTHTLPRVKKQITTQNCRPQTHRDTSKLALTLTLPPVSGQETRCKLAVLAFPPLLATYHNNLMEKTYDAFPAKVVENVFILLRCQ